MPNTINRTSNKSQPFTLESLFVGSSLSDSIDCSDEGVSFSSDEELTSVEEPSELDWIFELSRSSFIVGDNLVPAKMFFQ